MFSYTRMELENFKKDMEEARSKVNNFLIFEIIINMMPVPENKFENSNIILDTYI